jgi:hypothetical protein
VHRQGNQRGSSLRLSSTAAGVFLEGVSHGGTATEGKTSLARFGEGQAEGNYAGKSGAGEQAVGEDFEGG